MYVVGLFIGSDMRAFGMGDSAEFRRTDNISLWLLTDGLSTGSFAVTPSEAKRIADTFGLEMPADSQAKGA